MTKLYIDDLRTPDDSECAIVRSYDDAVHFMRGRGCPDFISFDHDLGDTGTLTGYDIAKWLVERDLNDNGRFIPKDFTFFVHSANPPGADNIRHLLNNYLNQREQ